MTNDYTSLEQAEIAKLRARLELIASQLNAAWSKRDDAPASAEAHLQEAAFAAFAFRKDKLGPEATELRKLLWDSHIEACQVLHIADAARKYVERLRPRRAQGGEVVSEQASKAVKVDATWIVELNCDCPGCGEHVNLLDAPDFWDGRKLEIPEHGTERSNAVEVQCPECGHEFEVCCQW